MAFLINTWKNILSAHLLDPCSNLDVEEDLEEINFLPFDIEEVEDANHKNACFLLSQKILYNIYEEDVFRFSHVEDLFEYIYKYILDDFKEGPLDRETFISSSSSYIGLSRIDGISCEIFEQDESSIDSLFELITSFLNLDKIK